MALDHPAPGFRCGAMNPRTGETCDLEPGTHKAKGRAPGLMIHATRDDSGHLQDWTRSGA